MIKALIIVMCLTLSACSNLSTLTNTKNSSTENLVNQNQYKKALELEQSRKNINTNVIKHIKRKATQYRRSELKFIQTLLIKKKWAKAELRLIELESSIPEHKHIRETYTQLNHLRNNEQLILLGDRYLAESALLKTQIKQSEFEERNQTRTFSWFKSDDPYIEKRNELANKLIQLTKESINKDKLSLANRSLKEAISLGTNIKTNELEVALKAEINRRNTATLAQKQAQYISQLKHAIENEHFEKIISLSNKLDNPVYKGESVKRVLREANTLLADNAKELDQMADQIYRKGNILLAIDLWQQSQTLYPNLRDVSDKLIRAQKVQNKLEALRQTQAH